MNPKDPQPTSHRWNWQVRNGRLESSLRPGAAPQRSPQGPSRRQFHQVAGALLGTIAAGSQATASSGMAASPGSPSRPVGEQLAIRLALKYSMIRESLSVLDKFKLVKDLGFEGIEVHTRDRQLSRQFQRASQKSDLVIHGVLNSNSPQIAAAVEWANELGATSVLCVAGRVTREVSYARNYQVTQDLIRQAIPAAGKHKIQLLVENVWNNFLLSPLEMVRYLDELQSPFVGSYFDVGNVVRFGWPQHWIEILGTRIKKLDIKEYSRKKQLEEGLWKGFEVELGDGDCDWPEVRQALRSIGYQGWATAEVRGGDRTRLAEVAEGMRRVLNLAAAKENSNGSHEST